MAVWLLSVYSAQPHRSLPLSAAPSAFSAARAARALARVLGHEQPHPLGSDANASVRARILDEFAALGLQARTYQAFTCNTWRGFNYLPCATVTDILADVLPGQGPAILMTAHYDSVPAGPGAADDEAGVAAVLEAARALRAGPRSTHPVMALFTDGEEAGLLGANAFLQNTVLKGRVGIVVNLEARGTRGASLLFQTSAGAGRLIQLYAQAVPALATSSLYAEIYRYLPNDTDLTLFLRAGLPGLNFAFADDVRYYHSPLDQQRHLSLASLQMQGESLLAVVRGLEQHPEAALAGQDDIYLSVLNAYLPRLPARWALPLALCLLIGIALATWGTRGAAAKGAAAERAASPIRAALMPPALLIGGTLAGFVLSNLAQQLAGMPDPSYAYPMPMRLALAFALWSMTLLAARMGTARQAAASAWLWMAALGVLSAAWLPGASPYFLFPTLVTALGLAAAAALPRGWRVRCHQITLFSGALAALIVWLGLAAGLETLMGLRLYALFTIPVGMAMLSLVPLVAAIPMTQRNWKSGIGLSAAAALLATALAACMPSYSVASPQRVNLIYLQNPSGARWIADSSWKTQRLEPIPVRLLTAGGFSRVSSVEPHFGIRDAYVAPAGAGAFRLPNARVLGTNASASAQDERSRNVELKLEGSALTDVMSLYIPAAAQLRSIRVRGQQLVIPPGWSGATRLLCVGRDCNDELVSLTLAGASAQLQLAEERYGLPALGTSLAAARPPSAMPSQSGDETLLVNSVQLR